MGWLDTSQERRRQHLQMVATGNIKDIDRIHERERFRRINFTLWILFIISVLIGWLTFKARYIENSFYFFGFAIVMLVILIFRYGWHKNFRGRSHNGWKKIDKLPNWAYRKMKRRRSNIVNGDHYTYKREGNKFYKRLK